MSWNMFFFGFIGNLSYKLRVLLYCVENFMFVQEPSLNAHTPGVRGDSKNAFLVH